MLYDIAAGLYLTRTRAYDPKTGRFLQRDILDEKGKDGVYAGFPFGKDAIGSNLYAWCGNNPINRVDPSGKWSWSTVGGIIGGILGGSAGARLGATVGAGVDYGIGYLSGYTGVNIGAVLPGYSGGGYGFTGYTAGRRAADPRGRGRTGVRGGSRVSAGSRSYPVSSSPIYRVTNGYQQYRMGTFTPRSTPAPKPVVQTRTVNVVVRGEININEQSSNVVSEESGGDGYRFSPGSFDMYFDAGDCLWWDYHYLGDQHWHCHAKPPWKQSLSDFILTGIFDFGDWWGQQNGYDEVPGHPESRH
jgi:RHS repeat-associated protein